jgi:hypothetical protein
MAIPASTIRDTRPSPRLPEDGTTSPKRTLAKEPLGEEGRLTIGAFHAPITRSLASFAPQSGRDPKASSRGQHSVCRRRALLLATLLAFQTRPAGAPLDRASPRTDSARSKRRRAGNPRFRAHYHSPDVARRARAPREPRERSRDMRAALAFASASRSLSKHSPRVSPRRATGPRQS